MKKLEIIKEIIEKEPDIYITNLLSIDKTYLLIKLCYLNQKYLTDDNLNYIIDNYKKHPLKNSSFDYYIGNEYLDISSLLSKYPNIINKLPGTIINSIDLIDWSNIIKKQPTLLDKCKVVDNFTSRNWVNILSEQPQLAFRYRNIYNELDLDDMVRLIYNSKEILNYVDIDKIKINSLYLHNIIPVYPEIINSLGKKMIDNISLHTWLTMIEKNQDLIDICPITIDDKTYKRYPNEVMQLIIKQPKFKYLLPNIDNIPEHNLVNLIINQPQLIDELHINLDRFDEIQWGHILKRQPYLIDKCNILNEIPAYDNSPTDWVSIISEQPKLIEYCKKINEFGSNNWENILKKQPQLVDKCNINLREVNLSNLLSAQPSLIKKLDTDYLSDFLFKKAIYNSKEYRIKALEKYIKKYKDSELLTNMIGIYPNLKDLYTEKDLWKYVDFNQLSDNLEYSILK